MPTAVVVGKGSRLFLVRLPSVEAFGFPWDADPERAATRRLHGRPEDLPSGLVTSIRALPSEARVVATDPVPPGTPANSTYRFPNSDDQSRERVGWEYCGSKKTVTGPLMAFAAASTSASAVKTLPPFLPPGW